MNRLFTLTAILLLSATVWADSMTYTDTTCPDSSDLLATISHLPQCIVDGFFSYIISGLIAALEGFITSSFNFLFTAPNLAWFCSPYNAIMSILESLFSLVLMGVALMFITRSSNAEGRLEAKIWLEKLLVMIVLLSFSFPIFQMATDLNTYLSTNLANSSIEATFTPSGSFTSAIFAFIVLLISTILLILTFLTLLIRYIMLPFLLLLFPVSIFLAFIPLTESWGKTFLRLIATVLFMTSLDALILLGLSTLLNQSDPNLSDALIHAFAVLFGFGLIGIFNLLLFVTSILSVITQSKSVSSVVGYAALKGILKK